MRREAMMVAPVVNPSLLAEGLGAFYRSRRTRSSRGARSDRFEIRHSAFMVGALVLAIAFMLGGCGSIPDASTNAQVGFGCGDTLPTLLPRIGSGITARFEEGQGVVVLTNSSNPPQSYGVGIAYGRNAEDQGTVQGFFLDDSKRIVVSTGFETTEVQGLVLTDSKRGSLAAQPLRLSPGSSIHLEVKDMMSRCAVHGESTTKQLAPGEYWLSAAISLFRLSPSGTPQRTGVLYATEPVKVHVD